MIVCFLVCGTVLVSGERKLVRQCCSPKETHSWEGHSRSVLDARLGRSIGYCVKMSQSRLASLWWEILMRVEGLSG